MAYYSQARCCLYSVRSYFPAGDPDQGMTHWTADYWRDSDGTYVNSIVGTGKPSPLSGDVLRVAIDAAGDVYVGGPRAHNGSGGWNIVKYDGTTGEQIYRLDVALGAVTGNVWSLVYSPITNIIYIHGDYDSIVDTNPAVAAINPDGSAASTSAITGSYTGGGTNGLMYNGSSPVWTPATVPNMIAGPDLLPYYQAIAGSQMATLGAHSPTGWPGWHCTIEDYPGGNPFGIPKYSFQIGYGSSYPNCTPRAVDLIDGGGEQLLAMAAESIYFSSLSDKAYLVLCDTSLDGGTAYSPSGGPITCRWRDNARLPTLLKFQDITYLISGAATTPKTQIVRVSDGVKAFGHNHHSITGVGVTSSAVVTVGSRSPKSADQDFV